MTTYAYETMSTENETCHAALVAPGQEIERGTSNPYRTACGRKTVTRRITRDPFPIAGSTLTHCQRCMNRVYALAERDELLRDGS